MSENNEQAPVAVGAGSDWDLGAIQKLLWNRRWLILVISAWVFLLTFGVTILKTPLYESSARMLIERSTPRVLQGEDIMPLVWNEYEIQRFYQTQYLLLKDTALLRKALDRHNLRFALQHALAPDPASQGHSADSKGDDLRMAEMIRSGLRIEQVERSNMVRVSFRHPKPQVAADVVNAVVETYRDYFVNSGLDARRDASNFLGKAIEDAKAEVVALDNQLAGVRRQLPTVIPASGAELGRSRLESIDGELTAAKARYAKAEARLHNYQETTPAAIEEVRANPQIMRYLETLAALRREQAELEGRVGPGWPRYKELTTAISETEQNLGQEQERLYKQALEAARADADRERRSVEQLSNLLDNELHRSADAQVQSTDYEAMRQAFEQKRAALDRLMARREEVALSAELKNVMERQVAILESALPSESPATPRVKTNLALGLVVGLFLGIAAAFLAEAIDNKVRSGAQIAELVHLPLLGTIPRLDGPMRPRLIFSKKRGEATPMMMAINHDVEESFRALRSSLMLSQPTRPPRILLVTSALPGEGKSTVAANLARTLASFGNRTVLIDCDLRHPRLHRLFDIKTTRGVTNLLASSITVHDVLQETGYENLAVIPGGPCPPDPATLLDPQRFTGVLNELSETEGFEFIIVDTPPVLVFADTFNLVPAVEGVVLVARAQVTPKDALRQVQESLRKVQAPVLGVLLNGEISEEHSGSYYRYYHYRRGYYKRAADQRAADGETAPGAAESVAAVEDREPKSRKASS